MQQGVSRVLVVSRPDNPDDLIRLICPDGHIELVDGKMTDDQLAVAYDADEVRHAPPIEWREGVFIDGPLKGQRSWISNQIGCSVQCGPTGGPFFRYELVAVAMGDEVPQLRFAGETEPPAK